VKLTLDIKEAGETAAFIISTKTMIHTVNQAEALFKNNRRAMLHELDVF
jgi:hypothetical protein